MRSLKIKLLYNFKFCIVFLILFIYVLSCNFFTRKCSSYNILDTELVGVVKKININGNKITMLIKADELVLATIYLDSFENKELFLNKVSLGDKMRLKGNFKNPKENTIFNGFNYKKYLIGKKIYMLFEINDYKVIKKGNLIYKIKDLIFKRINNMPNSDYLQALILGDKGLLSQETISNYQKNGISHLLAISGMHVGTFLLLLNIIIRNIKKEIRYFFIILFLLFMLFLTDFSASALRAVLFLILNIINKELELNYNNMQILFMTVGLILIVNPLMVRDIGLIYSFVVTFGILYNQEKINGNYFRKIYVISLIAFVYSLPITALLNYEVNLLSIFINLIFVPYISVIVYPLVLLNFVFRFLSPLLNILLESGNWFNDYLINFSVMINIPRVSCFFIVVYYFLLISIKNRLKYIGLVILLLINSLRPYLDNSLYIYYFDVNQGDSSVIIFPNKRKVVMIDTGGIIDYEKEEWKKSNKKYNVSDNVIKYLKSRGISKVDYLVLTHGDYDHIGDTQKILKSIKVKNVIFNCGEYNSLEKSIIKELKNKNIYYGSCVKHIMIDNNKLKFLNTQVYNNENDNSSVIYFNYNNYKMLFMGDAGVEVEEAIIKKYNIQDIDVLKVGHHGSKTSSSQTFINITYPNYSVISVGKNNRYGHPNSSVLKKLESSRIYRTDQDGTVMFKITNNRLEIKTCPP